MIIFKCKMCGGDLNIVPGATTCECEYCGSVQTLPRLDDDKRANLYDRANHFRRQNEYDKAMAIYEQILQEDRTDAEAYWSLVLCRYGVEYVEDPASHRRVPTVNRAQYASILADEDYRSALQYADAAQKGVYEAEAAAIAEIQKGILDISKKEEPFDVFICYKETDANGRRTPDSVLANDLYHQLTKEGFKVFFSRITLEDKIGTAYEPYIFAALNSAKVMVALGTKPEYFNAVWVKNEWSRYLALIRAGAEKTLVPAYRDMDPYDLPEEFAHLQAQDMGKLGFMQDLIRGIKKLTRKDEAKPQAAPAPAPQTAAQTAPLLERAFMFLEDGKWQEADEYCEKVLDIEPKNARAYLGKLMVQLRARREQDLKDQSQPFDRQDYYQKILRFGDDALKSQLGSDIEYIVRRNEYDRQKGIYDRAVQMLENAVTVEQCQEAAEEFESIFDFEDAEVQYRACKAKIERINDTAYQCAAKLQESGQFQMAIVSFKALNRYRDSATRIAECEVSIRDAAYQKAAKLQANGKWQEAIAAFKALNGYRDSTAKVAECEESIQDANYQWAVKLQSEGKWDKAVAEFEKLGDYRDSRQQIQRCRDGRDAEEREKRERQEAERRRMEAEAKAMAAKKRKTVIVVCVALALVVAAALIYTMVIKPQNTYNSAVAAMEAGNYDEATQTFEGLGNYKDAATQAQESQYRKGAALLASGEYDEATAVFETIGDYNDAATQAQESQYRNAEALSKEGNYQSAYRLYTALGDYKDSAQQADQTRHTILEEILQYFQYSVKLSLGSNHTVGLKSDGTVVATGSNNLGQCDVGGWTDIVAVSARTVHTVGLKSDGTVVATGSNDDGECDVGDWTDIVAVSAGDAHTVGLKSDGTVVATGKNYDGQCDVGDWTDIVAVSAGYYHTVGLKSDDTVVATGSNDDGECDVGDWTDIVAVSAGGKYTVGLKSDGTVVATGRNDDGQCDVGDWTDIVAVSAGDYHTVGLKSDGTVVATGSKFSGQCDVGDWTDIVAVSAWLGRTVGLKSDGTVVATGENDVGQYDVSDWNLLN